MMPGLTLGRWCCTATCRSQASWQGPTLVSRLSSTARLFVTEITCSYPNPYLNEVYSFKLLR